jgi:hypothetical protein
MKKFAVIMATIGIILVPGLAFSQSAPPTDSQITQSLESQGYSNIQISRHERSHIDVRATKSGKTERLAVNPQTGQISADTDKDED